ncbi:MAG: helix-turn-helix transcriptional regulator [Erysipelotrichaceae bacterium]|nr:helix-turn-helix transcriptional regulator [Clostridia bacterium]MBQ6217189.1 helix-turn-helix transcriptional regulator [Erysipelotrichaceae bacterium]
MKVDYELIGKRIKNIRTQQEMSQEQLSEYSDITPGYLSKIETGVAKPSLEVLISVSYSLGVSLDDLVYSDTHLDNFGIIKRMIVRLIDECTVNEQELIHYMTQCFIEFLTDHGIRF